MDKLIPTLKSQVVERISVGPASKVWAPSPTYLPGQGGFAKADATLEIMVMI